MGWLHESMTAREVQAPTGSRASRDCINAARDCLRTAQQHLAYSRVLLDDRGPARGAYAVATCSGREVLDRIAEAFEITPQEVVVDSAAVRAGGYSHVPIQRWLQDRHHWDGSVAPYYLAHLRGLLRRNGVQ
jgi:hypothetical protein